jgi:pilus assembly protein Flp/PilA
MAQQVPRVDIHLPAPVSSHTCTSGGRLTGRTPVMEGTGFMLDRLFRRDHGQGLVEYALIIALVAVVVIGILILLGPAIGSIFSNIQQNL